MDETERKLRTGYWFPDRDAEVEARVRHCNTCLAERKERDITLSNTEGNMSTSWSRVSLDLRRLPNRQLVAILIES